MKSYNYGVVYLCLVILFIFQNLNTYMTGTTTDMMVTVAPPLSILL